MKKTSDVKESTTICHLFEEFYVIIYAQIDAIPKVHIVRAE